MLANEKTVTAPITKANFWKQAWMFVEKNYPPPRNNLFTIRPGTENWKAWREYFERHLSWTPQHLKAVIDDKTGLKTLTVPTEYPQHFDFSFYPDPDWKEPAPKFYNERQHRETYAQLKARCGPNWGLKTQIPSGRFTLAEQREANAKLAAMAADIQAQKMERAKGIGDVADALMRRAMDEFDREFGG